MFEFKGRKLNISSELLSDNKRYRGCSLSEERATTYLINRYGEDDIENLQNSKMAIALEMYPSAIKWIKENIRL